MPTLSHFFTAAQTLILFGISPIVEDSGIATLTKPLLFNELHLVAGLPLLYTNLIQTKAKANDYKTQRAPAVS